MEKCNVECTLTERKKSHMSASELRVQKEISHLELSKHFELLLSRDNSLMDFHVKISPDTGLWKSQSFLFHFCIPSSYPYNPPKIRCETPIFHPNIDENGAVCLAELGLEWKPILSIDCLLHGLLNLFLEPNCEDPLNKEAAISYKEYQKNENRSYYKL